MLISVCVTSRGLHFSHHKGNMAENIYEGSYGALRRGGKYCVAGTPNGISCTNTSYTTGISMHRFPKNDIVRRKWVKFVRRHRDNFTPTSTSALCSAHFEASSYSRRTDISLNQEQDNEILTPYVKRLLIGASPTIDAAVQEKPNAKSIDRTRRQVSSHILN